MLFLYLESFSVPNECQTTDLAKLGDDQLRKSLAATQSVLMISTATHEPLKAKFLAYMKKLEVPFKKFKMTKACRTLRQQVADAEKIFDRTLE